MLNLKLTILLLALLASCCRAQQQQQQQEDQDQLVTSESNIQQQSVQAKPVLKQVLAELVNNAYQLGQASKTYLDTQPEFTQSWADFPYAPGYLPAVFKNSYTPYQQQQSQYKAQGGAPNPHSIGYGYVDFSGPINPANFYVSVSLPYYYRVPPTSSFYQPSQAIYQPPLVRPVYQPIVKPIVYSKPVYTPPVSKF